MAMLLIGCSAGLSGNRSVPAQPISAASSTDKEMEQEQANEKAKLTASFFVKEGSLSVEYSVKNNSGAPIYVFNVLLDTDAIETVSPHKFYSCLRDDGTVVLAKAIPKLPAIATVEVRDIPYTTKIEPGKEFVERVEISLPLEEYNPYFQKDHESKTEEREAERIFLVVQYIQQKEGLEVTETKIANAFRVYHPDLFGNVETLNSDTRPISFKVNRRVDTFERF